MSSLSEALVIGCPLFTSSSETVSFQFQEARTEAWFLTELLGLHHAFCLVLSQSRQSPDSLTLPPVTSSVLVANMISVLARVTPTSMPAQLSSASSQVRNSFSSAKGSHQPQPSSSWKSATSKVFLRTHAFCYFQGIRLETSSRKQSPLRLKHHSRREPQ